MQDGMMCPTNCGCHKVVPVLIVLMGVVFLLGALNVVSAQFVAMTWPILLILIGLKKCCAGMCKCCQKK